MVKQKGYIEVYQVAHCGICAETLRFTRHKTEEWLVEKGWNQTEHHGWVCPHCHNQTNRIKK